MRIEGARSGTTRTSQLSRLDTSLQTTCASMLHDSHERGSEQLSDICPKHDTMSLEAASNSRLWEMTATVKGLKLTKRLPKGKGTVAMRTVSGLLFWIGVIMTLGGTVGCQYYEDYRVKKATADLREEQADLLHDYRLCLEKYQDDPPKSKEMCGPYTQRLREIEVTHH